MYIKKSGGHVSGHCEQKSGSADFQCACVSNWENPENRRLRALYMKGAQERDGDFDNLQKIFSFITNHYTSGIEINVTVPYNLEKRLRDDLKAFNVTMAASMAMQVVRIDPEGKTLRDVLEEVAPVFEQNIDRLSNILYVHDLEIRSYLALEETRGGDAYLFISEQGDTTCERCAALHGRLLSQEELQSGGALPPLPPNCKCSLVALDSAAGYMYNLGSAAFAREVLKLLDGSGGLYRLDYSGYSQFNLSRIGISDFSAIVDGNHGGAKWYEALGDWAKKFGMDAMNLIDAFFRRGEQLFINASDAADENLLWGLVLFADAFTFGIVSGFLEANDARYNEAVENPSFYNWLNYYTFGIEEMLQGAFNPDDPWSFQHFMDMAGVATLFYGVVKAAGAIKPGSVDRLPDSIGPAASDFIDDAARAADDFIDDAARASTNPNALPNFESAKIDPSKIYNYALDPFNSVGGDKARVFESALGYNLSNADDLIAQVIQKLPDSDAVMGLLDQYGQRYSVDIAIIGPNGNTAIVRTGWIFDLGSDFPRLTTIYVK